MGFLNELRANPCVKGCPEDWSLHQMQASCKSFFHALESEWIPTFFISNEDRIKEDYEKQEGTDACFESSPIVAYQLLSGSTSQRCVEETSIIAMTMKSWII